MKTIHLCLYSLIIFLWVSQCETSPTENSKKSEPWSYFSLTEPWRYITSSSSSKTCKFHEQISESVNNTLRKYVFGQEESINTIVNILKTWEFQQNNVHDQQALFLAFTGDVGIGKSETAYRLAQGLFGTLKGSQHPCGLLTLMGGDYSDNSIHARTGGLAEVQKQLLARIGKHLEQSSADNSQHEAIIVFDEVQKIMPGALDILNDAFGPRGYIPITTLQPTVGDTSSSTTSAVLSSLSNIFSGGNKNTTSTVEYVHVTKRYPTNRLIFVCISDVGNDAMTKLLVSYGEREHIPIATLRNAVKHTLDEVLWNRIRVAHNINEVIPFLPLEPKHVEQVLHAKIDQLNEAFQSKLWLQLIVDNDVVEYLARGGFVMYSQVIGKSISEEEGDAAAAAAEGSTTTTTTIAHKVKYFAKYGARSVIIGGPYQDLTSLISRKLTPSPDKIVHIGLLANDHDRRLAKEKWNYQSQSTPTTTASASSSSTPTTEMFFQVCSPDASMLRYDTNTDLGGCPLTQPTKCAGSAFWLQLAKYGYSAEISTGQTFSKLCETIWIGRFPDR